MTSLPEVECQRWNRLPVSRSISAVTTRTERRKVETRTRLLDAAIAVVGEHGPHGAPVSEIARRADVALATLYNHFESKDALLSELGELLAREMSDELQRRARDESDSADALAAVVLALIRWFDDDPLRARFVLEAALAHRTMRHHLGAALTTVLRRGRASGRFVDDDLTLTAVAIGGTLTAALQLRSEAKRRSRYSPASLAAQVLRIAGITDAEARTVAARLAAR
jgi:AcrR family transcriptional regulator